MSKKQVWFRPDQTELVVEALKYVNRRLADNRNTNSGGAVFAQIYTSNRIDEVIQLFGEQS